MEQLQTRHVSGRLKVAPEHTSDDTLKVMRKPKFEHFHSFKKMYDKIDKKLNLNQKLVPYFISSHPACKEEDMANLAAETKDMGFQLEQVQDFTPTPMTVATVIYYSGYHPYKLQEYYVPKSKHEKKDQYKFFFWYKPENRQWIKDKLYGTKQAHLVDKLLSKPKSKKRYKGKANKFIKKHGNPNNQGMEMYMKPKKGSKGNPGCG
jgi:radical SAM superfamily enzyme YgiQ (UPF0313 family)